MTRCGFNGLLICNMLFAMSELNHRWLYIVRSNLTCTAMSKNENQKDFQLIRIIEVDRRIAIGRAGLKSLTRSAASTQPLLEVRKSASDLH